VDRASRNFAGIRVEVVGVRKKTYDVTEMTLPFTLRHDLLSEDDARRLYDFFKDAGYTIQGLKEVLGIVELPADHLRNLPRLIYRTREHCLLHILVRWFIIGLPVDQKTAQELIPSPVLELCLRCGMLLSEGGNLTASILLVPFGSLLIASDLAARLRWAKHPDVVLGVHPSARFLLSFTVRRPSRATLDLGTGCGVQGLAAAAHSEVVTMTDVNARATAFAEFNVWLNGFENIECLTGDGFAPVKDRSFDLIVSNPPFIIAPSRQFLYRDSGLELDLFCRQLVRQAPGFLNEGGYFQMICEWVAVDGQPWQERLAEWFDGTGCDVWVQKLYAQEASIYAQNRIRESDLDSAADAANFSEWMDFYVKNRVQAIHGGRIAMRRRSGRNWLCIQDVPVAPEEPFGDHVLAGFSARDFLQAHSSDEQMLKVTPKLSPGARLHQELQHSDSVWKPISIDLKLADGLPYLGHMETSMMDLLAACDGTLTIEELTRKFILKPDLEPAQRRDESSKLFRVLIEHGFLTA
jgi:hypothetical protein